MERVRSDSPPKLGFCGYSGSGKTTIVEKILPILTAAGIKAGYLKHDAHKLDIDKEGKDTARIFNAGSRVVCATSRAETFTRFAGGTSAIGFPDCDIVFVEGYKDAPWEKIWVYPLAGGDMPPLANVVATVGGDGFLHDDIAAIADFVFEWLRTKVEQKPFYGGILIGGSSSRMGRPKAIIEVDGVSMGERVYRVIEGRCEEVFLLGNGPVPAILGGVPRISDAPGFSGPLGGIVSASRFAPDADWFISAVDMPGVSENYLRSLAAKRGPGWRFIGAKDPENGLPEPLCSLYSSNLLAKIASMEPGGMSVVGVLTVLGMEGMSDLYDRAVLKNVNYPSDLSV